MGCGGSKQSATEGTKKIVNNASQVVSSAPKNTLAPTMNLNAWDHPNPMDTPYPKGKPDALLSQIRNPDLIVSESVPISREIVDEQMVGEIVKESWAIKEGYTYYRIDNKKY